MSLLASNWCQDKSIRKWSLCRPCEHFRQNYDRVQAMIARIGCMDELISGTMHVCSSSSQASSPSTFWRLTVFNMGGERRGTVLLCEIFTFHGRKTRHSYIMWNIYLPWVGKGGNLLLTGRTNFNHMFFVINTEWFIFCFINVQNSSATTKENAQSLFRPFLSSVYLTISQLRQSCCQEIFLIWVQGLHVKAWE